MNDDPKKRLSDAEETALRALAGDRTPTPGLEDRVVTELKRRGHIRANGGWIMKSTKAIAAAAVLGVVFVAGLATGLRSTTTKPAPTEHAVTSPAGEQYMLLMYMRGAQHREERAEPSAAYAAIVAEYRDWAVAREREGRLVSAEKLSDETRVMTAHGGETAIVQTADTDRVLGGYFLITARSLDEAIEIAKSHPHLKYGGEVEIRPVESTAPRD